MGIRKVYETENNGTIDFGLDRDNGVFMQVFNNGEPSTNWSEFSPFHLRFTYDNIQKGIKEGLILKQDFEEICKIPMGDFKVYFSGVMTTEEVSEDFVYPKTLLNHIYNGTGFRVRTLGDYYKRLKLFRTPITFSQVTWYENGNTLYKIENDYASQF